MAEERHEKTFFNDIADTGRPCVFSVNIIRAQKLQYAEGKIMIKLTFIISSKTIRYITRMKSILRYSTYLYSIYILFILFIFAKSRIQLRLYSENNFKLIRFLINVTISRWKSHGRKAKCSSILRLLSEESNGTVVILIQLKKYRSWKIKERKAKKIWILINPKTRFFARSLVDSMENNWSHERGGERGGKRDIIGRRSLSCIS